MPTGDIRNYQGQECSSLFFLLGFVLGISSCAALQRFNNRYADLRLPASATIRYLYKVFLLADYDIYPGDIRSIATARNDG